MNLYSRVRNFFTGAVGSVAYSGMKYFKLGSAVVNPETAYTSSVYLRCVSLIAGSVAKLDFGIFDKDMNRMYNRLNYLLNTTPNGEMTAHDFKHLAIMTAINRGNFYAQIIRNSIGEPIRLIYIETTRVTLRRTVSGELYYDVISVDGKIPNRRFSPEDIFHLKNIHLTSDGCMGVAAVTYGRNHLALNLSLTQTVVNFFKNASLPMGIITSKFRVDPDTEARMKKTFNKDDEDDSATDAVGGLPIMQEGMDYKPTEYKEDPLQFLSSRKLSRIEIATMLNVSPAFVYDVEVLKTSKMQEVELSLYKDCLSVWISKFQNEVNMKLLNESYADKTCKADVDILLLEDRRSMAEYDTKMHQMSVFNANEIRLKRHNLPAVEGGERRFIAANNLKPLDRLDDLIDSDVEKSKNNQVKDVTPEQIENIVVKVLTGGSSE